jgi:lipoprotein LpqH
LREENPAPTSLSDGEIPALSRRRFCTVNTQWVVAAATLLAVSGCSSQPPGPQLPPGALIAGTAQVTVNSQNTGTTEAVQCTPAGSLTTITTGDQASGVTALVSNKDELTAAAVDINNVGGFTGSYNAGLGGAAKVTMTGRTYDITGTADGFNTDNPSFRTSGTFAIKVSC